MAVDVPLTRNLSRFVALIEALRAGPLARPDLLERLRDSYPAGESARRMVDRDVAQLAQLGIRISVNPKRPPIYTLHGGQPVFDDKELRALALIRDTFGQRHPQAQSVRALLDRLTEALSDAEQRHYLRRQVQRAPVDPAIDYTDFAPLFDTLNAAIHARRRLTFFYRPLRKVQHTRHHEVEPMEIVFYERHFYLVAYTPLVHQVLDFRIDRIRYDETFSQLDYLPPEMLHRRQLVKFRYRLAAEIARGGVSERFENQRIIETLPGGDVVIEAEGRSDFFIIQALLRYRSNAELLEPAWLRERMRDEVRGVAALYEP